MLPKAENRAAMNEATRHPVITEVKRASEGGMYRGMYLGARALKIRSSAAMNIWSQTAA